MNLEEKLAKLRAGAQERVPADARKIMHDATDALRNSGILDGVSKPPAAAPAFALPNIDGESVSSESVLARGPLVATFYRGVW
ncbi:MAG: hypothetical protein AAFY88_07635 [Acidobacteriota bacterium]